jgi:hypothetical protein
VGPRSHWLRKKGDRVLFAVKRLSPSNDESNGGRKVPPSVLPVPTERDDLPYKVEIWDEDKTAVEQVLAVTASASIGYAAFYAAAKEFPLRYITLRFKNRVVTRWNGPAH